MKSSQHRLECVALELEGIFFCSQVLHCQYSNYCFSILAACLTKAEGYPQEDHYASSCCKDSRDSTGVWAQVLHRARDELTYQKLGFYSLEGPHGVRSGSLRSWHMVAGALQARIFPSRHLAIMDCNFCCSCCCFCLFVSPLFLVLVLVFWGGVCGVFNTLAWINNLQTK